MILESWGHSWTLEREMYPRAGTRDEHDELYDYVIILSLHNSPAISMPAGLRSKDSEFLIIILASSSSSSCYSPILCPRSGLLVDHFVLRPVAELATSTCWYGQPLAFLTNRLILFISFDLRTRAFAQCVVFTLWRRRICGRL